MITNNPALGKTFDEAAQLYDETRPGYPVELFDQVWRYAGLRAGSRAVESGPGTGQATLELAKRGLAIDAVEPGLKLAAVARDKLQNYPNIRFYIGKFEEVNLSAGVYDLVYAATSFHWVEPSVRYVKARQLLRLGGSLAVFWNQHIAHADSTKDTFFYDAQQFYEQYDPLTKPGSFHLSPPSHVQSLTTEMMDSGFFDQAETHQYLWDATYKTDEYIKLLRTYSPTIAMPSSKREALLQSIRGLIDSKYGGQVHKQYVATLDLARAK
ncbi:MAG TPA: class I SAM-dependent methyltransferase [Candidatus Saccharimonadales bacterium]|nr:class I SAM-dependent methyltransferase [Candidatus Saccharimonadales bacterium]